MSDAGGGGGDVLKQIGSDEEITEGRRGELDQGAGDKGEQGSEAAKLFVGGLDRQLTEDALKSKFEAYGEVVSATIMTRDGRSRGFGFVQMADEGAAEKAIDDLHGKEIEGLCVPGKDCSVKKAQPRERGPRRDMPPRHSGGYGPPRGRSPPRRGRSPPRDYYGSRPYDGPRSPPRGGPPPGAYHGRPGGRDGYGDGGRDRYPPRRDMPMDRGYPPRDDRGPPDYSRDDRGPPPRGDNYGGGYGGGYRPRDPVDAAPPYREQDSYPPRDGPPGAGGGRYDAPPPGNYETGHGGRDGGGYADSSRDRYPPREQRFNGRDDRDYPPRDNSRGAPPNRYDQAGYSSGPAPVERSSRQYRSAPYEARGYDNRPRQADNRNDSGGYGSGYGGR